jgi:hypothetical protein
LSFLILNGIRVVACDSARSHETRRLRGPGSSVRVLWSR